MGWEVDTEQLLGILLLLHSHMTFCFLPFHSTGTLPMNLCHALIWRSQRFPPLNCAYCICSLCIMWVWRHISKALVKMAVLVSLDLSLQVLSNADTLQIAATRPGTGTLGKSLGEAPRITPPATKPSPMQEVVFAAAPRQVVARSCYSPTAHQKTNRWVGAMNRWAVVPRRSCCCCPLQTNRQASAKSSCHWWTSSWVSGVATTMSRGLKFLRNLPFSFASTGGRRGSFWVLVSPNHKELHFRALLHSPPPKKAFKIIKPPPHLTWKTVLIISHWVGPNKTLYGFCSWYNPRYWACSYRLQYKKHRDIFLWLPLPMSLRNLAEELNPDLSSLKTYLFSQ